jgi:hypothetical protein
MSIEASSSGTSVAARPASPSNTENGIEINEGQTWDEASALLPKSAVDEVEEEAEGVWSPQSLGPGFIWIQAGWNSPSPHFRSPADETPSHLLQCLPLWIRRHNHSVYICSHRL